MPVKAALAAECGNIFGAWIAMLPTKEHRDEKP
jgi:hypothetical protein